MITQNLAVAEDVNISNSNGTKTGINGSDTVLKLPPLPHDRMVEDMIRELPNKFAGEILSNSEKLRLFTNRALEDVGFDGSGKTLTLKEDPKSGELSIQLSQLVIGKTNDDILEVTRLIDKRDVLKASYHEISGLKKELESKGLSSAVCNKEPSLYNVLPEQAKELLVKASIGNSRGQQYAVINTIPSSDHSSKHNISFYSNLTQAVSAAMESKGSLVKTNDLKETLAYQKGGDIHITPSIASLNDYEKAITKQRQNDPSFKMPPLTEIMKTVDLHLSLDKEPVPTTLIRHVPGVIDGVSLSAADKEQLLLGKQLQDFGGSGSGKTLRLIEDNKTKELSIELTQRVPGKDGNIIEINRIINQGEVSTSYAEASGLKKECFDKGIDTAPLKNAPVLFDLWPTEVKALETKAAIANSRGQNYAVIGPYLRDPQNRSKDPNISFHYTLKSAVDAVRQHGGTIAKTNDLKSSLAYQKEGGTIHILSNIHNKEEKQSKIALSKVQHL